ncbi:class I SAM-dependent methyltransferase [archaeon]|nr:MAG: class I SAM-dependent methyltransferase [archaeon]
METEDDFISPYYWIEGDSLAPPCPTDYAIVNDMLDMLSDFMGADETLMDLGCGDGRICISAAKRFGCKAIGVEIEEELIKRFREKVEKQGVQDKVQIVQGDLLTIDLSVASIIVLYLLPEAIVLIEDKLKAALQRGVIVLTNTWGIKGIEPAQVRDVGSTHNVRLRMYNSLSVSAVHT